MRYFRKEIQDLAPYVPGEQLAAGAKVIKLNTNENPYPPSPATVWVLRNFDAEALRRYPDPQAAAARHTAAGVLGVEDQWLLAGNGSDELLAMIILAAAGPGRCVAYATPTYVLYRTLSQMHGAPPVEVLYDDDYNLPVDELIAAAADVTFVCSPNSPSGTMPSPQQLERLAEGLSGLLVIDEAYIDFADDQAAGLELAQKRDNVIVLRTLSKGYSLAGLRFALAVANPDILADLVKVKDSYNVDAVACAVAEAAFKDQAHKNANAKKVRASREKLTGELERLGFRVIPSQSNFLLARPSDGDAARLYESLKARRILVRYFIQPRLDDKIRITVGTDEQNDALVEALGKLL